MLRSLRKALLVAPLPPIDLHTLVPAAARGQEFPTRPIRVALPFPPGGDTIGHCGMSTCAIGAGTLAVARAVAQGIAG